MTTFLDGPAQNHGLQLKLAPEFLRVVRDTRGEYDGLDQPNDEPSAYETIWAYQRVGKASVCHLNFGRGRGGWYAIASYRLCIAPPPESVMRSTSEWNAWVESQKS